MLVCQNSFIIFEYVLIQLGWGEIPMLGFFWYVQLQRVKFNSASWRSRLSSASWRFIFCSHAPIRCFSPMINRLARIFKSKDAMCE